MRRAFVALTIAVAAFVGAAPHALADTKDREAAAILDAVPVPPDSAPVDLDDRARTYRVQADAVTVLAHFRDALEAAGWREKAVSPVPANNNGVGTSDSSSRKVTGPVRANWSMAGALLRLKITTAATADHQTQGENDDQSTFVLRARPPR